MSDFTFLAYDVAKGAAERDASIALGVILSTGLLLDGCGYSRRTFLRFAKKASNGDAALCEAIRDAERGLIAANLGGGVIKQRIARAGGGKSGGFRTLIVFRAAERAFFVHGFAKNEKDNINHDELAALKKLASELLALDDEAVARVLVSGTLTEVTCDEKTIP
jgi:hypothetical protein